jgi:hypothetical protein
MLAIREALDCNGEFVPPVSPLCLARALVELAGSFARPILWSENIPIVEIDASNMRMFCRRLIESLPSLNYSVFIYLISFYREVLKEGDFNRFVGKLAFVSSQLVKTYFTILLCLQINTLQDGGHLHPNLHGGIN